MLKGNHSKLQADISNTSYVSGQIKTMIIQIPKTMQCRCWNLDHPLHVEEKVRGYKVKKKQLRMKMLLYS